MTLGLADKGNNSMLLSYAKSSPAIMQVLQVISDLPAELWLGGGSVRNFVWDCLTNRTTQGHDFDIIYFDPNCLDEAVEKEIEGKIRSKLPRTFNISVKNQARMHIVNKEPESISLVSSIENWPETATALALRIGTDGELELIAPYGCDDLLNMIIRPTPYHAINRSAYERRLREKEWGKYWPEVKIESPPQEVKQEKTEAI